MVPSFQFEKPDEIKAFSNKLPTICKSANGFVGRHGHMCSKRPGPYPNHSGAMTSAETTVPGTIVSQLLSFQTHDEGS